MKAIKRTSFLAVLVFFCSQNFLSAQILHIDSIGIFGDTAKVDSIQFIGTASGQKIDAISFLPYNDVCGTLIFTLTFKGCSPIHYNFIDTTVSYGFKTERIIVYSVWDTSSFCSVPKQKMVTDTAIWSICGLTGIASRNLIENKIKIYPNPAKGSLYIEKLEQINIEELYLTDIAGKVVRRFNSKETSLDVSALASGNYLLQFKIKDGAFVKKVVLE